MNTPPPPWHAEPERPTAVARFRAWFSGRSLVAKIALVSVFVLCGLPALCACPFVALSAVVNGGASSTGPSTTIAATQPARATATPRATATHAPTATATHAPTATATHAPTATATATDTATPVPLPLAFTCAEAVDYTSGRVCVHTVPGAQLTITVTYCSGKDAKSGNLGPATADSNGNHEWDWVPDTVCKGEATAIVTASANGQTVSASDSFNVA